MAPTTGFLNVSTDLEGRLEDKKTGDPLPRTSYRLQLSTGEIRTGTTDRNGKFKETRVPVGPVSLLY